MSINDIDAHKLHLHPEIVSLWKKTGACPPIEVEIGVTNRCNHKCKMCTLDWITHGKVDIDPEVLFRVIDCFGEMGVKSIYFAGEGEPTLHHKLSWFIDHANSWGIKTSMSTNGSAFSNSLANEVAPMLSWIRFSVDAVNPTIYKGIHGASDIDDVLSNIEYLVSIKRRNNYKINIGIQAVLMPDNIEDLFPLATVSKQLGVDNFQVKPCHNHPKSSYKHHFYEYSRNELNNKLLSLSDDKFKVIVREKSIERLYKPRNYKRCHGFDFYALIDANGDVVPCNVFYKTLVFGNIYQDSFLDIWNNKKKIIDHIESMNFQQCGEYRCRFDVMNRYLERIAHPEESDEFI